VTRGWRSGSYRRSSPVPLRDRPGLVKKYISEGRRPASVFTSCGEDRAEPVVTTHCFRGRTLLAGAARFDAFCLVAYLFDGLAGCSTSRRSCTTDRHRRTSARRTLRDHPVRSHVPHEQLPPAVRRGCARHPRVPRTVLRSVPARHPRMTSATPRTAGRKAARAGTCERNRMVSAGYAALRVPTMAIGPCTIAWK